MISRYKERVKQRITRRLLDGEAHVSYSQEGEDVVLRRYLNLEKAGFYVDIGAHHPVRYSNTKYYYDRGWRGINIDADPDLMLEFEKQRPLDKNLLAGVGSMAQSMTFHIFNHPAINTFDERLALKRAKLPEFELVNKIKVKVRPLAALLKKHVATNQDIDFFSIDVEGRDLDVLKSNDWAKYRPRYIMVECLKAVDSLDAVLGDQVTIFLRGQGYKPIAKTLYTVIFGVS